ncbi:hypothetical protein P3S68_013551 [Capsicum galapagoense]
MLHQVTEKVMANKDIESVVTNQIGSSENENLGANEEIQKLRQQMIETHQAWANGFSPPPVPTDNLKYLSSLPPVSHAQFPIFIDMAQHTTIYLAPPVVHALAAPPPPEAPTFGVHPQIVPPYSTREPALDITGDQRYTFEPTLKLTGIYGDSHPPEFSPNTEKPVMIEEQKEMTKKLRSLELAMKNLQGLGGYKSVSYKDLYMFPGVHLSFGFKMPKFEKYDGYGDPIAHLRRYFNQLRGAGGKEELLMAYFGESLSGLASEWFVDQDIDKWISWDDLANEFVQQFQYNVELIPNEKSLTNMKKKSTETFREYAIRWREQDARVKSSMKESKIVEVFIQAQDGTYYQHLLPVLGKPFIEVLKMGEMIEDEIKTGRIVSFPTLKATTQAIQKGSESVRGKKYEEDASAIVVGKQARARGPHHRYPQAQTQAYAQAPQNLFQNPLYCIPPPTYPIYNAQPYGQFPSYLQWRAPTLWSQPQTPQTYQSPSRSDFRSKPYNEMRQKLKDSFTLIGESYANLFQRLVQRGMITLLLGYTPDPHSKHFDANVRCAYHSDVQGHSIEDCRSLKRKRERMIQDKLIMV